MKYLFSSIFLLLVLTSSVSAEELPVDPMLYPPGTYVDEPYYIAPGCEDMFEIIPSMSTFDLTESENASYQIDESIKVTQMSYVTRVAGGSVATQGNFAFGSTYIAPNSYVATFYNDGNLLFENPGTLYFQILSISDSNNTAYLNVYRSSGSSEVYNLSSSVDGVVNYFEIDNLLADIVKITLSGSSTSPEYGYYCGFNFQKYGYVYPTDSPGTDSDVPVPGDTSGVLTFLFNFVFDMVDTLFLLEIVSGVTFGYFIVACIVLTIFFSFLFTKIFK